MDTHTHTHTFILYADAHTDTHVVQTIRFFHGGSDSASRLDSPSTWRHVSFVVYEFISLLSWTLWTQCPPHPLLSSRPVLQPHTYPLPTKAGKYSMALTRNKKRKRDRQADTEGERDGERERKELRCLSHFFFLLLFFFDRCLCLFLLGL